MKPKIPSAKDQINLKHQITNKPACHCKARAGRSQTPNTNYPDYSDFSSIDENIFFNSFGLLHDYKVWNFEFRSL
ncbi:MAG: hypothetical protein B6I30_04105 [Desulfobacteraceae bacterium 4572_187]|nr:MAG: hypothetical protein B6I30_04105 [Desulfobacteraceae bacterium 4572_187]